MSASPLSDAPLVTLLRDADVYAPEPLGRVDVLVAGERVLAVGPSLPSLPSLAALGAVEVDLGGRRVIPGLVDGHVHLTGGGGESGPASRVPPVTLSMLSGAGITTVVGLLGTDCTTRTMADLAARTLALRDEGISAYCWTGGYECPPVTLTGSVRRDITFVDPIVGVGELAISDHRSSQPTFDEVMRVAADARVAGLMSGKAGVLHLHLGDGKRGLALLRRALDETELPASVFHPTHLNRRRALFDEGLALAERGVCIDVTAFPPDDLADDTATDEYSADDAIARYLAAGLPVERVTCSSDGAGCLPVFDASGRLVSMDVGRPALLFDALRRLHARGVALPTALLPFTVNPAKLLKLSRKGRIFAGGDADLVVLASDGAIHDVMARGRFLVRQGKALVRGPFEPVMRDLP